MTQPGVTETKVKMGDPEAQYEGSRRSNSTVWVVAIMALLSIAIVTAGFLGAFYMLKETALNQADQMQEIIVPRTQQMPQMPNYNMPMGQMPNMQQAQMPNIQQDDTKGLMVLVDKYRKACLVAPQPDKEMEATAKAEYMKTHPNPEKDPKDMDGPFMPHMEEVKDTSVLGETISTACQDMKVFWMYPQEVPEEKLPKDGTLSRQKRWGKRGKKGGYGYGYGYGFPLYYSSYLYYPRYYYLPYYSLYSYLPYYSYYPSYGFYGYGGKGGKGKKW